MNFPFLSKTLIFSQLILFIFQTTLFAQLKLEKLSRWDDNQNILPVGNQYYNDVYGYVDSNGGEYAILGSVDGTYIIDITDPYNPVKIDKIDSWHKACINRDVKTYKHYAISVADQGLSSLQIIDLQYLPDSVVLVYDSDELVQRTHNIFVEGDRLYLASHTEKDGQRFPMSVLSLEDPKNPVLIGRLTAPHIDGEPMFDHVHDVYVRNDTAYCSNGYGGFFIYKFIDPFNPELISALTKYPFAGYNHSNWLSDDGNILVFADETHGSPLKAFDVSNKRNMKFLSAFGKMHSSGSIVHNPYILDTLIIIAYYHEGLVVFDMSDPSNIVEVASYETFTDNYDSDGKPFYIGYEGCWGAYPWLPSGNIIASDMTYGLHVFSLNADPAYSINKLIKNELTFDVYPNPFSDEFHINFNYPLQNKEIQLNITEMNGKIVYSKSAELNSDKQMTIKPGLENGIYILSIISPTTSHHIRIVKLN